MNAKDFFSELLDRTSRNSFRITFIFIWCLKNWILVYSLFNFDETATLESKLKFIQTYIVDHSHPQFLWIPIDLLWYPLLLTFFSILLYQTSKFLAQFIYTFFEQRGYKYVIKVVATKEKLKLKSDYDNLEKEKNKIASELESSILKRQEYQKKIDQIEIEHEEKINNEYINNEKLRGRIDQLQGAISELDLKYRGALISYPKPLGDDVSILEKYFTDKWKKYYKTGNRETENEEDFYISENIYYIQEANKNTYKPYFYIFNVKFIEGKLIFNKFRFFDGLIFQTELYVDKVNQLYNGFEYEINNPFNKTSIRYSKMSRSFL